MGGASGAGYHDQQVLRLPCRTVCILRLCFRMFFPLVKMPKLAEVELQGKELNEEEYHHELKQLQKRLGELHNRLYWKRVPVIITYEGWDAAGKGGNIKRITGALDPRGL